MPDVLYGTKAVYDDTELVARLNANGCATLKEVDYYMRLSGKDDNYTFVSKTNKMVIRENLFDSCMLVSGKKDEQGYIPEGYIIRDTANFLYRLSSNKFIGNNDVDGDRRLLRDVFFEDDDHAVTGWKLEHDDEDIRKSNCYYKVVSEADYHIPVREMENICENDVFSQAYKGLYRSPFKEGSAEEDIKAVIAEFVSFLQEAPGEEIKLGVNGLIQFGQLTKPAYKTIKKGTDGLRESLAKKMETFEKELPVIIKSLKKKLMTSLDEVIVKYMKTYGPYGAIDVIGDPSAGVTDSTKGMVAEVGRLEKLLADYTPSGEYTRIIDSIKAIVAKRFFTFPSAKRETENGYFEACIKETLAAERTKLMEEIDAQDLFGDTLRWLRQRAERLDEIYSQFGDDLKNSIEDLSFKGSQMALGILKKAKRHEFLPSDYVTDRRIDEMQKGIIRLMLDNESNIDNGRVVPVKDEMEKLYRELFSGVGAYGPEKMLAVAFSDKKVTEQDLNVMFGSPVNDRRTAVMEEAARAFVDDISGDEPLCVLKDDYKSKLLSKKYISVPNVMPYFSKAVKAILMAKPYNEKEDSITLNPGEIEISIDNMFVGVPVSMMACAMEMQMAYNAVYDYKGLHIDEVNKDMKSFPNFVDI